MADLKTFCSINVGETTSDVGIICIAFDRHLFLLVAFSDLCYVSLKKLIAETTAEKVI